MTPKRILIVEDSQTVVEQMKLFLRAGTYKVTHAGSEFGMYQMIEEYGKLVDLIIMDLNLKSENGLDLISKLKENEKYAEIPVIVVTEHARRDFILRARDLKVNDYIRKPITKDVFLERISRVLGDSDTGSAPTFIEDEPAGEPDSDLGEKEATGVALDGAVESDIETKTEIENPSQDLQDSTSELDSETGGTL